eukprot:TRINITY_DN691_c0_g1_i1.p1 TRINITY_DN691_c0_g1~~TRINITY_DN691_c0_g1_i1.p1  ORF type:complete len:281 (+),score=100.48 TRINITY_DN691_c0_g1_i1:47-889(+)
MADFAGKHVLVTGGGSGIGRLMCLRFAALHCTVITCDIREDALQETKEMVEEEHPDATVLTFKCDLSSREDIYAFADRVLASVDQVDVVINNAGIVSGKHFLDVPDASVERTMNVNCLAHMWLAKKFLPPMMERNSGHWVTIASAAATCGVPGLADYCASKWGAMGFHESIRTELKKKGHTGVKTLVVCPYYINTGMFAGVQTRFPIILPILEPNYVVNNIVNYILWDKEALYLPGVVRLNFFFRAILPPSCYDWVADFLGISSNMDEFKGRTSSSPSSS